MTGVFLLDWAIVACSLFNASLMLWLGLTIALNAERQGGMTERRGPAWGPALIAGSLLAGALFFISHSAILAFDLNTVSLGLNFWWRVAWGPVLALPLAWYVLVLWYAGYWTEGNTALHTTAQRLDRSRERHRLGLWINGLTIAGLVVLVLFANPLPALGPQPGATAFGLVTIGGLPLLILAYPIFVVLCLGLSLDALLRPGPTARVLGDQARRRARPWLAAATGLLLVVGLLVAWVMLWIIRRVAGPPIEPLIIDHALAITIGWFDLVISALIGAAVVVVGQALVAYEVFTGKTLPRRGLLRFWRNAVALSAGYSLLAAWSLTLQLRPIYSVLLTAALLSVFYALFSWRAYAERESYMRQLRPFVAGQPLYQQLLEQARTPAGEAPTAAADPQTAAAAASFQALCRAVLGARLAYLVPLGPAAPLAGPALSYAEPNAAPQLDGPHAAPLAALVTSREVSAFPVEPAQAGGAYLALPLWSERPALALLGRSAAGPAAEGLIGLLLLGEKSDGGLYTQEEIDIARAGGERLMDALASAELARRLLVLQRQRLAESQVVDQRTRRVLHDDVLPQLHAALLHLHSEAAAQSAPATAEAAALLAAAHRQIAELLRELPAGPLPDVARLGLVDALRKSVAGEFARSFDAVDWALTPEAEARARALPDLTAEVLFYAAREALRNAARHARRGQAAAPLRVRLAVTLPRADGLELTIEDDGAGVDSADGAGGVGSPASTSSSGQGLALHATLLAVVGGTLTVESQPGAFTRVRLLI